MKGIASLDIAADFVEQLLGFPTDAVIISSEDADAGIIRILVSHDSIPSDAAVVSAKFVKVHAARVFEGFEVVKRRQKVV